LGVFNLFPFPGLDGGRLLFLVIEAILGKPLNRNVEGYIHFVGIIILLGLALTVTFNDILRLFTK
jgi:regulator of sigma E protease